MTLLVIRHAESVENAGKHSGFYRDPRPYDGSTAHWMARELVGLTPRGFHQARWLGDVLSSWALQDRRVYTSTYRRAIDTAAVALPDLPVGWPRRTEQLDEQHYGDATYMTKREQFDRYPALADDRRQRKHIWTAPGGGESLAEGVGSRAARFAALAVDELKSGCTILAFTHQTMAVALRSLLEHRALPDVLADEKRAKMPNAAILRYDLRAGLFTRTSTTIPPM